MPDSAPPPQVLIATDVFGNTPAVASLVRQLGVTALVVSPHEEERQFRNEQLAYQAFLAIGGVARYADKLAQVLQQEQINYAIGFSAGASALWINASQPQAALLQAMTLFYGSRIRDQRTLLPRCPVRLIFAEQEAAFDPAELAADLQRRGHAAEIAKGSRHGFMNPYSRGSCVKAQARYTQELQEQMQGAFTLAAA
ncbi:MAG: dienelactone hydrolase family protein [Burkholderiales bacterium]|nr:dienelactone hydrolase family protein [Burkholderiales bacterium]